MGTKLSHLQKHRKRLGWQTSKAIPANQQKHSNTRYTAEEYLTNTKHKAKSGSEPSVHSRLSDTTNPQSTQTLSFNVLDRYTEQICIRRQWEEKMERLNEKYGLNCFSDSKLDSELDEGKNY